MSAEQIAEKIVKSLMLNGPPNHIEQTPLFHVFGNILAQSHVQALCVSTNLWNSL